MAPGIFHQAGCCCGCYCEHCDPSNISCDWSTIFSGINLCLGCYNYPIPNGSLQITTPLSSPNQSIPLSSITGGCDYLGDIAASGVITVYSNTGCTGTTTTHTITTLRCVFTITPVQYWIRLKYISSAGRDFYVFEGVWPHTSGTLCPARTINSNCTACGWGGCGAARIAMGTGGSVILAPV